MWYYSGSYWRLSKEVCHGCDGDVWITPSLLFCSAWFQYFGSTVSCSGSSTTLISLTYTSATGFRISLTISLSPFAEFRRRSSIALTTVKMSVQPFYQPLSLEVPLQWWILVKGHVLKCCRILLVPIGDSSSAESFLFFSFFPPCEFNSTSRSALDATSAGPNTCWESFRQKKLEKLTISGALPPAVIPFWSCVYLWTSFEAP